MTELYVEKPKLAWSSFQSRLRSLYYLWWRRRSMQAIEIHSGAKNAGTMVKVERNSNKAFKSDFMTWPNRVEWTYLTWNLSENILLILCTPSLCSKGYMEKEPSSCWISHWLTRAKVNLAADACGGETVQTAQTGLQILISSKNIYILQVAWHRET